MKDGDEMREKGEIDRKRAKGACFFSGDGRHKEK